MKSVILIIIICIKSTLLFCDSLYLSNNSIVKGTIISLGEDIVRIETQNGILEVDKSRIVRGEFFGTGKELSGELVFEYLLDGRIKDSSGNSYIIKSKSIPYTEGVLNDEKGALQSKGSGQYFYIEDSKKISEIDNFTISLNFYPVDTSENRFLISNWKNTFSDGKAEGRFSLSVLNKDLIFFVVDSNGYYQSVGSKDILKIKEWNSLAIRFNDGEMSLWVNGETVAKNRIKENRLLKGNWPLFFLTAKYGNDYNKYNIIGNIDNIRMYNTSLNDEELNLLYKSGK